MKRQPTLWENIFANDLSAKVLISKIHIKDLHSSTPKKRNQKTSEWKMGREPEETFSKETYKCPTDI